MVDGSFSKDEMHPWKSETNSLSTLIIATAFLFGNKLKYQPFRHLNNQTVIFLICSHNEYKFQSPLNKTNKIIINLKIIPCIKGILRRSYHCNSSAATPKQRFICCGLIPELHRLRFIYAELLQQAPCPPLIVAYKRYCADLGNEGNPVHCKDEPVVKWCADPEKFYTIIILYPDAPCGIMPSFRSWLHWCPLNKMNKIINLKIIPCIKETLRRSSHCHWGAATPKQRFICCGLIPELLQQAPCQPLIVAYKRFCADLGNELNPVHCKDEPTVKWCANPEKFYTVIMLDPDAPCRIMPSSRSWLHWLVTNIPSSSIERGRTIASYVGPAPPRNTGYHRYVFLVFEQLSMINFQEKFISNCCVEGRPKFDLRCFTQKYSLGEPLAGNFFKAEWDCYVENINRQLKVKS